MADGTQGAGKVLSSDSAGLASWQSIPTFTETDQKVGSSSANQIPKWNGTTLTDGLITDNGTNVGIGTSIPVAKLDVTGNIKIADGPQGSGKVLTSDAYGLATWGNLSVLPTGRNNQTLRYNGSMVLASSTIVNTGSAEGIWRSQSAGYTA